jgi:hypothetical protein
MYLDAGDNNSAISNYQSFLAAIESYGIPSRVRSDKGSTSVFHYRQLSIPYCSQMVYSYRPIIGGENVLVAQFMLNTRGLGRSSHICGRSVHNQRFVP